MLCGEHLGFLATPACLVTTGRVNHLLCQRTESSAKRVKA